MLAWKRLEPSSGRVFVVRRTLWCAERNAMNDRSLRRTKPEVSRYRLGNNVHFIQARKAWEDTDTWLMMMLLDQDDDLVTVAEPTAANIDETPVWITERWRVLAVPSDPGNVFRINEARDGSIFQLTAADTLRFYTITDLKDEPVGDPELVYATLVGLDGIERFLIAPRATMEDVARVVQVVTTSRTWGEVRENASAELYQELLNRAGYGTLEDYLVGVEEGTPIPGHAAAATEDYEDLGYDRPPDDDEPFHASMIDSYMCGDFPPMVEHIMESFLPRRIVRDYGRSYETSINGSFVEIDPAHADEVIAALEVRGHTCTEDSEIFIADMFRWEDVPPEPLRPVRRSE